MRWRILLALMAAGLHQATESRARRAAIGRDIDDVLEQQMVQQEPINRAVVAPGEALAKSIAVQPAQSGLALEGAPHEAHLPRVGKQIHDFVVQTLVQIIAVRVLQLADCLCVVEPPDFLGKLLNALRQGAQISGTSHGNISVQWSFTLPASCHTVPSEPNRLKGRFKWHPLKPVSRVTCASRPKKPGRRARCWISIGARWRKTRSTIRDSS